MTTTLYYIVKLLFQTFVACFLGYMIGEATKYYNLDVRIGLALAFIVGFSYPFIGTWLKNSR